MTARSPFAPDAQPFAITKDVAAHFLHTHLRLQQQPVMRYILGGRTVWLKKAGKPHSAWRYRVLSLLARTLRVPALMPVPNPGGGVAIATEVRRLQALASKGLLAPALLAVRDDGFLMADLGNHHTPATSLADALDYASTHHVSSVMGLWIGGLQALGKVHEAGDCLSQAFARNLVQCPDATIGFIDFEDDPAAHLPLALCQARDILCYLHSTALYLEVSGTLDGAIGYLAAWVPTCDPQVQQVLHTTAYRLRWVRRLPASRSLGRDTLRVRAAYALLSRSLAAGDAP